MILCHGWADPGANQMNTISYYEAVKDTLEARQGGPMLESFLRLYLVPGMAHCGGGIGHDQVDWLTALRGWVERGEAPMEVIGGRASDESTRPHCPYPQQPSYSPSAGEVRSAESFVCREG